MSTLLLADGDPSVRTTLARSLAGYGFAVIATASVQEAVGVLRSREVDVLVTEIMVPGADDLALLAHVKQHAAGLPTVVLSAADPAAYGEQLAEHGLPPVLRKPLSVKELVHTVRGVLSEAVRGRVTGIGLPSLLQMLEWERKTCSVRATGAAGRGRLDFTAGELVNAYSYTSRAEGEAAAFEIFSWDDAVLELERLHPSAKRLGRLIHTSLQRLLIDAMRQKDERAQQAPANTPDDAVLVGETEDEMFFRRRRTPAAPTPAVQTPAVQAKADPAAAHVATLPAPTAVVDLTVGLSAPAAAPEGLSGATTTSTDALTDASNDALAARVPGLLEGLLSGTDGALAALLVDYGSGVALGQAGGGVNLQVAAVGNTQVVRAKLKTMADLGLSEELEDILITLSTQYHLLRVLPGRKLFVYLALSRRANLARARLKLKSLTDLMNA